MSPDLHARSVQIFSQAIEIEDEAARLAFADSATAHNPELRGRVFEMLKADQEPGLAQPALDMAAQLMGDPIASHIRNTRLGSYLIGEMIGAGGMGTVYEARDVRLERKVAVKILPSHFVRDKERVQRFRQEARAASLLNHPNIVSIYDADFDHGRYYIATEFIEGQTLRQMLAGGPLELARVIEIGTQLCSALAAAHQAGIAHRDIKPENVMARPDGIVKVLDFGLAKLIEPSGHSMLETEAGTFAGTGPYVSPEQLNGKPATPQSDLFSAGVLLYELATGVRPFQGATHVAVGSAILHDQPALPSSLAPSLGAEFDAIILRTLEKNPELRYQTAGDLRTGLRLLARGASHLSASQWKPTPRFSNRRPLWFGFALGVASTTILVAVLWLSFRPSARPTPVRFERLTEAPGEEIFANLMPDGKQFIYTSPERGKWDIYLQRVGGKTTSNLTLGSTANDREPALSRDGSRIAFRSERAGGGLFLMEATGENPVRIAAAGHLPSWSPDGRSIVYSDDGFVIPNVRSAPTSRLHIIDVQSGVARKLETADAVQPNWSPHGYRIAYWGISDSGQRDIFTVAADHISSPAAVTSDVFLDWNPVWSPSGDMLYFISDRGGAMNLWRVPIDERTGVTHGPPEPVTTPAGYVKSLAFSADGSRFVYSSSASRVNLFSIEFDSERLEVNGRPILADGVHNITNFSFSPDDRSIVYDTLLDANEEIAIENLKDHSRRRLVSDGFRNRLPRFSPDGDDIVFFSNRSGGEFNEWAVHPDGGELRPLTGVRSNPVLSAAWLDRDRVIASRQNGDLILLNRTATGPSANFSVLPGGAGRGAVTLSEKILDGMALGIAYSESVNEELLIYHYPAGELERIGISGRDPEWLPGSKHRFIFLRDTTCWLYDMNTRKEKQLFSIAPNRFYDIHASADGRRIWFTQTIREADVWMGEMESRGTSKPRP